ncbi:hypothetical protein AcV7_002580 [Taiwanofungus camphoratus]|nr:hypothetical protein AcV7_002580 [Antrodia cinnamomea]
MPKLRLSACAPTIPRQHCFQSSIYRRTLAFSSISTPQSMVGGIGMRVRLIFTHLLWLGLTAVGVTSACRIPTFL